MRRSAMVVCCLLLGVPAAGQVVTETGSGAVLRALDKVTGRTSDLDLQAGETVTYGRLSVRLDACRFPAENRAGDAFAGLEIREADREAPVFEGWMIASAPALSALDHPQYDVWVIRCTTS